MDYPPLTPHGLLKLTCSPRTSCDYEVKGKHDRTVNIGGEDLHTHSSHSLILCDSYCRARKTYHSLCNKILDVQLSMCTCKTGFHYYIHVQSLLRDMTKEHEKSHKYTTKNSDFSHIYIIYKASNRSFTR